VSYPILVERLAGETVLDMGCNACGHWWRTNDPEEFMLLTNVGCCPRCESFSTHPRYDVGVRCPGCGELSTMLEVSGACSRRCMLVAEYAAQLQKGPE
jgi:hypothetical protein